jgi:hypothetical protein
MWPIRPRRTGGRTRTGSRRRRPGTAASGNDRPSHRADSRRHRGHRRAADDRAPAAGVSHRRSRPEVVAHCSHTAGGRRTDRRGTPRGRGAHAQRALRSVRHRGRALRRDRARRGPVRAVGWPAARAAVLRGHRRRLRAHQPAADDAGQAGRHRCRCRRVDHRGRQRVQLHGRRERHLGRARPYRWRGLRLPRGVARGPVPVRRGHRGRRGRARLPAMERGPGPGLPGRRRQLHAGRGGGGPSRLCRPAPCAGRSGDRPARPVPRGHHMDAAAAHPGWRTLVRGAPHAYLSALVRRGLVASAGNGGERSRDGHALPARSGQPHREPSPPGHRRPGRGRPAGHLSRVACTAGPPHQ